MKKLLFIIIGLGIMFALVETANTEVLKVQSVRHNQGRVYVRVEGESQDQLILLWDGLPGANQIIEITQNFVQISSVRKGVRFQLSFPPSEKSPVGKNFMKILSNHADKIGTCFSNRGNFVEARVEVWLY